MDEQQYKMAESCEAAAVLHTNTAGAIDTGSIRALPAGFQDDVVSI